MRPDELRLAIRAVREVTSSPYQVNLFVPDASVNYQPQQHAEALDRLKQIYASYGLDFASVKAQARNDFSELVQVVLEEKTPIVSFTFGIPDIDIITKLRQSNCTLMGTATCVAEAISLSEANFDIIVAQGFEAGGHRATFHSTLHGSKEIPNIGLFALVPQIIDKVQIPVVASGGIMDGKGILAALALGAAGVQLGTAFMGCPEAGLTDSWRDALLQSADTDTTLTGVFSGRLARGISNRFMAEMLTVRNNVPPFPIQNSLTGPLRAEAKRRGDSQYQSLWAGQAAKFTRRMPAATLIETLADEVAGATKSLAASTIHMGKNRGLLNPKFSG